MQMLDKKKKIDFLFWRQEKKYGDRGDQEQETRNKMPLTPAQEANVRELFSMFKDAFQRDHKRKCDAIDAMMNNFVESYPGDSKEVKIKRLKKRLKSILGSELVDEVSLDRRTKLRASRAQASSSASSSTHSNSAPSASSSSSASSNVTEDDEVICTGERTVEERNREGFANAIVLDEDEDEDDDQLDA